MQTLYVRRLSRHERLNLMDAAKYGDDARIVNRTRVILLSDQGKRISEISELLDMAKTCIATWIRRYEAKGIDGLYDRFRSGRPRTANQDYERRMLKLIKKPPQRHDPDLPWSLWTVDRLRRQLTREGFPDVSDDTVRRILHRRRYGFLRPKLDLKHKQDPAELKVFTRQMNAAKKTWLPIPIGAYSCLETKRTYI